MFNKLVKSYATDICFAGIGHIGFYNRAGFTLAAYGLDRSGISIRKPMYPRVIHLPPHLDEDMIQVGLENGDLYEGMVFQRRPGTARVASSRPVPTASPSAPLTSNTTTTNIMLKGRDALNRAMHGDRVAVRLLPKALWVKPGTADEEDADVEGDEVLNEVLDEWRRWWTLRRLRMRSSHQVGTFSRRLQLQAAMAVTAMVRQLMQGHCYRAGRSSEY